MPLSAIRGETGGVSISQPTFRQSIVRGWPILCAFCKGWAFRAVGAGFVYAGRSPTLSQRTRKDGPPADWLPVIPSEAGILALLRPRMPAAQAKYQDPSLSLGNNRV